MQKTQKSKLCHFISCVFTRFRWYFNMLFSVQLLFFLTTSICTLSPSYKSHWHLMEPFIFLARAIQWTNSRALGVFWTRLVGRLWVTSRWICSQWIWLWVTFSIVEHGRHEFSSIRPLVCPSLPPWNSIYNPIVPVNRWIGSKHWLKIQSGTVATWSLHFSTCMKFGWSVGAR
jgi:hypothetical protein